MGQLKIIINGNARKIHRSGGSRNGDHDTFTQHILFWNWHNRGWSSCWWNIPGNKQHHRRILATDSFPVPLFGVDLVILHWVVNLQKEQEIRSSLIVRTVWR